MRQVIRSTTIIKWKPIHGFPNYYISNNGLVKRGSALLNPKLRKGRIDYLYIIANNPISGKSHRLDIHRLVWDMFGPMPHRTGYEVHHKDLNPQNNSVGNLELIPMLEHKKIHSYHRSIQS
jgi:hypothetical protein